ncbi:hypothetical protein [Rhizobium sp. PL01]|uniref:hypothetical protein n=1 Tax=Rhizobium sp. PL01 TaxID=3085631 RepID=UPI002980C550|nr:hypothetical protein [Rhizobium sp. PL01]MDW5313425.1 hypothetical protein [Rhizobium sp. PL01]
MLGALGFTQFFALVAGCLATGIVGVLVTVEHGGAILDRQHDRFVRLCRVSGDLLLLFRRRGIDDLRHHCGHNRRFGRLLRLFYGWIGGWIGLWLDSRCRLLSGYRRLAFHCRLHGSGWVCGWLFLSWLLLLCLLRILGSLLFRSLLFAQQALLFCSSSIIRCLLASGCSIISGLLFCSRRIIGGLLLCGLLFGRGSGASFVSSLLLGGLFLGSSCCCGLIGSFLFSRLLFGGGRRSGFIRSLLLGGLLFGSRTSGSIVSSFLLGGLLLGCSGSSGFISGLLFSSLLFGGRRSSGLIGGSLLSGLLFLHLTLLLCFLRSLLLSGRFVGSLLFCGPLFSCLLLCCLLFCGLLFGCSCGFFGLLLLLLTQQFLFV